MAIIDKGGEIKQLNEKIAEAHRAEDEDLIKELQRKKTILINQALLAKKTNQTAKTEIKQLAKALPPSSELKGKLEELHEQLLADYKIIEPALQENRKLRKYIGQILEKVR